MALSGWGEPLSRAATEEEEKIIAELGYTRKDKPQTRKEIWKERFQKAVLIVRHPFQIYRFTRGSKKLEKIMPPMTEEAAIEVTERINRMSLRPPGFKIIESSTDINDPIGSLDVTVDFE